ncbi:unnamed protein product [Soboliphyme baturini]|uniref:Uncharacterized protein n=1 Tax=Soboliphyme baturini TaxID=241478 RepID=A0A183IX00_9BILA|nr:unnamed protein product [Soboliphyme baturini]
MCARKQGNEKCQCHVSRRFFSPPHRDASIAMIFLSLYRTKQLTRFVYPPLPHSSVTPPWKPNSELTRGYETRLARPLSRLTIDDDDDDDRKTNSDGHSFSAGFERWLGK